MQSQPVHRLRLHGLVNRNRAERKQRQLPKHEGGLGNQQRQRRDAANPKTVEPKREGGLPRFSKSVVRAPRLRQGSIRPATT